MRMRPVRTLAVIGVLALLLQGCDKFPYAYFGSFPRRIPAGTELEVTSVLFAAQNSFPAGSVQISGQLTPSASGSPLPSTLRVIVRRTQPGGAVVDTSTFELTVGPTGVIANQLFTVTGTTVNAGEELRVVFQPIGIALPVGQIKLKLLYENA